MKITGKIRLNYKKEIEQLLNLGIVSRSKQNSFIKYTKENYRRKNYNNYEPYYKNFLEFPEPYDTFEDVYMCWHYKKQF